MKNFLIYIRCKQGWLYHDTYIRDSKEKALSDFIHYNPDFIKEDVSIEEGRHYKVRKDN